ncbi:MAG TPA: hypothetical protein VKA84_18270 [Gemmatimonadaceae bacterium]|nr:hypothetical protein [Gemmatimonadaceae bacterium]
MTKEIVVQSSADGSVASASIPPDVLQRLDAKPGDRLILTETQEGILLTRADAPLAEGMRAYELIKRKYGNALRELASK